MHGGSAAQQMGQATYGTVDFSSYKSWPEEPQIRSAQSGAIEICVPRIANTERRRNGHISVSVWQKTTGNLAVEFLAMVEMLERRSPFCRQIEMSW